MRLALPLTLRCDAIGISLKEVINGCRDRILSPYLIHSRHQKQPKPMSKDNLSDYFAKARELAGIIPPAGKTPPTFHEQRSLSERLYRAQGVDTKHYWGIKSVQPPIAITILEVRNGLSWLFDKNNHPGL